MVLAIAKMKGEGGDSGACDLTAHDLVAAKPRKKECATR
jgi:hypothetical protein